VNKETTPPEKETSKLINVDASSFDGSKKSLNNLTKRIRQKKKDSPDIQVRTPKITDPQFFKAIFEAGATSHQILPPKDKKIIPINFLELLRAFFGSH